MLKGFGEMKKRFAFAIFNILEEDNYIYVEEGYSILSILEQMTGVKYNTYEEYQWFYEDDEMVLSEYIEIK